MLDYNNIEVMRLQLITLRVVSVENNSLYCMPVFTALHPSDDKRTIEGQSVYVLFTLCAVYSCVRLRWWWSFGDWWASGFTAPAFVVCGPGPASVAGR